MHGKTRLLAEPTAEDLADSIIEVLSDENKAKQFGTEAQRYSMDFGWEKSAQKHLKIYERLIVARN
ncbi:MAG: glycosyltransferase [Nitrososphaerales archaeon]